jgi:hypothetical protein
VDGALTSLFTTPIPKFYSANDLKATLSNNTGFLALTKYTWGPAQLFAGWEYFRQGNPSDDFPNGFKTIGNYSVPGNILDNKAFQRSGSQPTLSTSSASTTPSGLASNMRSTTGST